jgi:hypothetical protein
MEPPLRRGTSGPTKAARPPETLRLLNSTSQITQNWEKSSTPSRIGNFSSLEQSIRWQAAREKGER